MRSRYRAALKTFGLAALLISTLGRTAQAETMTLDLEARAPRITVEQSVDGVQLRLSAVNECACDAQFAVRIDSPGNVSLPPVPTVPAVPDKADAKASAGILLCPRPSVIGVATSGGNTTATRTEVP